MAVGTRTKSDAASCEVQVDERLLISVGGVVVGAHFIHSAIGAQAVLAVPQSLLDTLAGQLGLQDD